MLPRSSLALALIAAGPATAAQDAGARERDPVELAQISIHERITIRIERARVRADPAGAPGPASPTAPPIRWKENRGGKCLALDQIGGASLYQPGAIDLVVKGGKRFRARLGDQCPTLDYYQGFYIKPTADGKVCAERDAIRSRSGAVCPIEEFRRLVPAK